jgi:uncharacterized protein YjbI with pentapeptide repeats
MIDESLNLEIWDRLYQAKILDDLSLPIKDGRIDLGGLVLPEPMILGRYHTPIANVTKIEPSAIFRGAKWRDLDFTGSKLKGMRFFGCEIQNCSFQKCDLEGLRWWSMKVADCSFKGANLKEAALGGIQEGRRNIYSSVDFSEADLRGIACFTAVFDHCIFRNSKLVKIDFDGSAFNDCVFEGSLNDVLFWHRGFKEKGFPPNEMKNVDFRHATLRAVGFRGLTLAHVRLPEDDKHIVIKNFTSVLDKMLEALKGQEDKLSKKLTIFLHIYRKWAVPDQVQGVLNIQDIVETVGEEGLRRIRDLLRS